ncbi:MAG: lipopolysaccharide biosynthesis protein [Mucilaginibacter polytrichastri]|nr:lipopolysaccharide biosynthesis protein [Mucilaginibacter polytrichastri]
MSDQYSPHTSPHEQVTLKQLVGQFSIWYNYLVSKWKIILLFTCAGIILGVVYAKMKKPLYKAECTFVLQDDSKSSFSQYAGIASALGLDLGMGGSSGIFQGGNIIDLYQSRSMIEKALLGQVTWNNKPVKLIDRYIDINNLREKWNESKTLKDFKFTDDVNRGLSRTQDSLLGRFVKDIRDNYLKVDKTEKNSNIISVQVSSPDEFFSKEFADRIVRTVNEFYIQTTTKKSFKNLSILQHQADSIRIALNRNISGVASDIEANPNPNAARLSLRVPAQKRQVDAEANKAILSELVKNLEISKVTLRRETPLIQVIDTPVYPLDIQRLGTIKAGIIGGFLFGFLVTGILFGRYILRSLLQSDQAAQN